MRSGWMVWCALWGLWACESGTQRGAVGDGGATEGGDPFVADTGGGPLDSAYTATSDEVADTQPVGTADGGSGTVGTVVIDTENPYLTPQGAHNADRLDRLTCTYRTVEERDDGTVVGEVTVGNANTSYVWNGSVFAIYDVAFTTTSQILSAKTADFIAISHRRTDDKTVVFDFGWQSVFPLGDLITFTVELEPAGQYPYLARCVPHYIRGDVVYPEYPTVSRSFWPGKEHVTFDDLVPRDLQDTYYQEDVGAVTEGVYVYDPPNPTQVLIGLPVSMRDVYDENPNGDGLIVNGYTDVRLFMPSPLLAMGSAFAYEWFKFNPNYFCALGTKENFACGLVPVTTYQGGIPVELDGASYSWPYTNSPDGPFQQETGNFIDMAAFFPDYFPPGATHDAYTNLRDPSDPDDPVWARAVVSSALSSVVTRETLWAVLEDDYRSLVFDAADPMAELAVITFAYNRGIYSVCPTGVFDDMAATLAAPNVAQKFGLTGVGNHVGQISAMVANMNQATDRWYDTRLRKEDVTAFFDAIRFVFVQAMDDAQWQAMLTDVLRAYDVLAAHWDDGMVSFRYDFLTLLRVAKTHLPKPANVRPASEQWKDRVTQFTC